MVCHNVRLVFLHRLEQPLKVRRGKPRRKIIRVTSRVYRILEHPLMVIAGDAQKASWLSALVEERMRRIRRCQDAVAITTLDPFGIACVIPSTEGKPAFQQVKELRVWMFM